jgi:hypothetical protein
MPVIREVDRRFTDKTEMIGLLKNLVLVKCDRTVS